MPLIVQRNLESGLSAFLSCLGLIIITGSLGPLQRLSGTNNIDLTTELSALGKDRDVVTIDGEESTVNRSFNDIPRCGGYAHGAISEKRQHRLMLRQDTDLPIKGSSDNSRRGARPNLTVNRNQSDVEFTHVSQPASRRSSRRPRHHRRGRTPALAGGRTRPRTVP